MIRAGAPRRTAAPAAPAPSAMASRTRTAAAVCAGAALLFAAPFLVHLSNKGTPLIDSSKPLKQEAVRRGAFNNSGSKDVGPDPAWRDGVRRPGR
jgi:hypothetical protein